VTTLCVELLSVKAIVDIKFGLLGLGHFHQKLKSITAMSNNTLDLNLISSYLIRGKKCQLNVVNAEKLLSLSLELMKGLNVMFALNVVM
jgi:hypothetical protein